MKINNFNDWTLSLYDYTLNPSYGGSEVGLEKYPAKLRYLQDPTFLGCQGIFLQCRRPDSDFPMDCPGSRLSFKVKFLLFLIKNRNLLWKAWSSPGGQGGDDG